MAGVSETRVMNDLLSTTLANFEGKVEDNVFDDTPFLSWLNGKLGGITRRNGVVKVTHDGGESIVKHIMYETNATAKSYSGAGIIDTTLQDGITIARFDWKNYAATIGITGTDLKKNRGTARIANLLEAKRMQAIYSLQQSLSEDAFGDGTGNDGKDLTGLQALIDSTTTTGGLAPATYTTWAAHETSVGSYAAGGKAKVKTAINTTNIGSRVDVMFTTQTVFESIENAEDDKERFVSHDALAIGFDNILLKKVPVFFDRDCPSQTMFGLNSNHISWDVMEGTDFLVEPFQKPTDQDVHTAKILFMGNLCVNNRRKHFKLTGITA